jgi:chromosome segregation ATPase
MPDLNEYISRINDKIQLLLKQHTYVQKENEKLKTELAELRNRAKDRDELIEQLQLRIDVLKASKSQLSEDEKKSYEKKINLYLKEIDKCIALLNE